VDDLRPIDVAVGKERERAATGRITRVRPSAAELGRPVERDLRDGWPRKIDMNVFLRDACALMPGDARRGIQADADTGSVLKAT